MREKAELKALRAQINPHFLFNTINIIMSFCRTSPETARNLLGHLATIMQYSFAKHEDFVTIGEELEEIRAYLEIAKSRFGSRLTVAMNIAPHVLRYKIPVLSIQPLVENAIQHGLFPKLSECHLTIQANQIDETVTISVTDNGVGINQNKLTSLFSTEAEGIGIQNVHYRLTGIYGSTYGLTITSQPGAGTEAIIRIPCPKEESIHAV